MQSLLAIADPTRRRIIELLAVRERTAGELVKEFDMSAPAISQHLNVLREAGLIKGCMPSSGYFNYGKKGEGDWITVYARKGHVFMTVAGLRLDTGGPGGRSGPRWKPQTRAGKGHVMRHPSGL